MLVLPPGVYGAAAAGGGAASASARRERLLTSSMDGTLRLWDVSADLMSLEVCVGGLLLCFRTIMHVFSVQALGASIEEDRATRRPPPREGPCLRVKTICFGGGEKKPKRRGAPSAMSECVYFDRLWMYGGAKLACSRASVVRSFFVGVFEKKS